MIISHPKISCTSVAKVGIRVDEVCGMRCGTRTKMAAVSVRGAVYRNGRYKGRRCGTAPPVSQSAVPHRKLRYDDWNCGTT